MFRGEWFWFAGALTLAGCDSSKPAPARGQSSPGASQQYLVVVGGFDCPAALPGRFEMGSFALCMKQGAQPSDLPPSVCANLNDCQISNAPTSQTGATQPGSGAGGATATAMVAPPPLAIPSSTASFGFGVCSQTTVETVVNEIIAQHTALAGIATFYSPVPPQVSGNPSDHYEVVLSQDAIWVAFAVCVGGTVAGVCQDRELSFFQTNAQCEPIEAGSVKQTIVNGCYQVTGEVPAEFSNLDIPAQERCDFDPMSQSIAGSYSIAGLGMGSLCGATLALSSPPVQLQLSVVQAANDLGQATLTLSGDGLGCAADLQFTGRVVQDTVEAEILLDDTGNVITGNPCAPAKLTLNFGFGAPPFGGVFAGTLDYSTLDSCPDGGAPQYRYQGGYHFLLQ